MTYGDGSVQFLVNILAVVSRTKKEDPINICFSPASFLPISNADTCDVNIASSLFSIVCTHRFDN